MKSRFLRIVWLAIFLGCPASYSQDASDLREEVDALASKFSASEELTGFTIGVARGKDTLFLKGYGFADLENSVAASETTVYRIGSITKMFTAAAILLLVEEEKISLDDSISKYLNEYPDGERITIRHLLTHTSGIFSYTDLPGFLKRARHDLKPAEIMALFQDEPVHFSPGEMFRYCNSGYLLLGIILEKVTGQQYETFLKDRIFEPLDLDATVYDRHRKIIPNRARGYAKRGDQTVNAPFVSMSQPYSAGALASTAGDLLNWMRSLAGGKVLNSELFQQMTTPGELINGTKIKYGFGCFLDKVDGRTAVRHGGGIPGFVSELAYFPESELTVAVLINTNQNVARKMVNQIAKLYLTEPEAPDR